MFHKRKREKLFGSRIDPDCSVCSHYQEETHSCPLDRKKRGESPLPPDGTGCPHFDYDPLRRTPKGTPRLRPYDPEDFSL